MNNDIEKQQSGSDRLCHTIAGTIELIVSFAIIALIAIAGLAVIGIILFIALLIFYA